MGPQCLNRCSSTYRKQTSDWHLLLGVLLKSNCTTIGSGFSSLDDWQYSEVWYSSRRSSPRHLMSRLVSCPISHYLSLEKYFHCVLCFFSWLDLLKSKLAVIPLADSGCVCVQRMKKCLGDTSWAECEESAPAFSVNVHPRPSSWQSWPRCAFSPRGPTVNLKPRPAGVAQPASPAL